MDIKSVKTQLAIFLGLLALYISFIEHDISFFLGVVVAIVVSIVTDWVINYSKTKRKMITESSIVTGIILGYVLSSDLSWWIISIAAIVAIGSKHIVRLNNKHIFNPAAFGIVLLSLWFGIITQWKAAYMWPIIVPAGLYFSSKIKKLDMVLSYFIASIILYGSQAMIYKTSLLNILGFFNYFFILIMIIEPKTTPNKRMPRIIFGLASALVIFAFYETKVLLEVELSALLMLNFASFVLLNRKKEAV